MMLTLPAGAGTIALDWGLWEEGAHVLGCTHRWHFHLTELGRMKGVGCSSNATDPHFSYGHLVKFLE